jgi:hypothetical protein
VGDVIPVLRFTVLRVRNYPGAQKSSRLPGPGVENPDSRSRNLVASGDRSAGTGLGLWTRTRPAGIGRSGDACTHASRRIAAEALSGCVGAGPQPGVSGVTCAL